MADHVVDLRTTAALGDVSFSHGGITLREETSGEMCSVTARRHEVQHFEAILEEILGTALPAPGRMLACPGGFVFWSAPRQWFVYNDAEGERYDLRLASHFSDAACVTLQTDAWARLAISGVGAGALFERLIPIDMSDSAFPAGSAARTTLHHIHVIVLRLPGEVQRYQLMCARSYGLSMLRAVERTLPIVIEEEQAKLLLKR